MRRIRDSLCALLWMLSAGCFQDDIVAKFTTARDASIAPTNDAGTSDYCDGRGPPILVSDGPRRECGGRVAERTFRYALCVCEDLAASHDIMTDAYDSRAGPYAPGRRGGAVGVNSRFAANATTDIGGTLVVGGTGGIQTGMSPLIVGRRLFDRGPLAADGDVRIGDDAVIQGSVRAANLEVQGSLVVVDATDINVSGRLDVERTEMRTVEIAPPCDCGSGLVDIAAFVQTHRSDNDNNSIQLAEDRLANVSVPTTLSLPCGRFFLSRVSGSGDITLAIEGRVALFIEGDFAPAGRFDVRLEPGAELDLFVGNNIVASNMLTLGGADVAASVRIYVGGSGTIQLDSGAVVAGNLYAPRAELTSSGRVETYGALFVRRLAVSERVVVHYDTAVLEVGDDCAEPIPGQCSSCADCRNQACVNGECGRCTTSADCCAPLTCTAGACIAEF